MNKEDRILRLLTKWARIEAVIHDACSDTSGPEGECLDSIYYLADEKIAKCINLIKETG